MIERAGRKRSDRGGAGKGRAQTEGERPTAGRFYRGKPGAERPRREQPETGQRATERGREGRLPVSAMKVLIANHAFPSCLHGISFYGRLSF